MTTEQLMADARSYNYYTAFCAIRELRARGVTIDTADTVVSDAAIDGRLPGVEGWDACCRSSGR